MELKIFSPWYVQMWVAVLSNIKNNTGFCQNIGFYRFYRLFWENIGPTFKI